MGHWTIFPGVIRFSYFFRMIGSCGSCGQTIAANELVMKSQTSVYHVKCFACVTCHSQLVPGDRYSVVNGSILCEQDYPKVIKGHTSLPTRTTQKIQFPTLVWSEFVSCVYELFCLSGQTQEGFQINHTLWGEKSQWLRNQPPQDLVCNQTTLSHQMACRCMGLLRLCSFWTNLLTDIEAIRNNYTMGRSACTYM